MAGVLRFGIVSVVSKSAKPLIKINVPVVVQACGISGKTLRGKTIRPEPFPYKEKDYDVWRAFVDKTSKRFDENSRVSGMQRVHSVTI
jgi:NADH dehydrogenase (ubiquinone) 1 alpha subcomplex subunit 10